MKTLQELRGNFAAANAEFDRHATRALQLLGIDGCRNDSDISAIFGDEDTASHNCALVISRIAALQPLPKNDRRIKRAVRLITQVGLLATKLKLLLPPEENLLDKSAATV